MGSSIIGKEESNCLYVRNAISDYSKFSYDEAKVIEIKLSDDYITTISLSELEELLLSIASEIKCKGIMKTFIEKLRKRIEKELVKK